MGFYIHLALLLRGPKTMTSRSNVFTKYPFLKYHSLLKDLEVLGGISSYRGRVVKVQDESVHHLVLQTSAHKMMKKKKKKVGVSLKSLHGANRGKFEHQILIITDYYLLNKIKTLESLFA